MASMQEVSVHVPGWVGWVLMPGWLLMLPVFILSGGVHGGYAHVELWALPTIGNAVVFAGLARGILVVRRRFAGRDERDKSQSKAR